MKFNAKTNDGAKGEDRVPTANEVAKTLGLREEKIKEVRILKRGENKPEAIAVTLTTAKATKKIKTQVAASKVSNREIESVQARESDWAELVVYRVSRKRDGEMMELKDHIRELNNINIAREPHWLSKADEVNATRNLVIHVYNNNARNEILATLEKEEEYKGFRGICIDDGYMKNARSLKDHHCREYVAKAMMREQQCTSCSGYG